jgi:rare lipoprotein A
MKTLASLLTAALCLAGSLLASAALAQGASAPAPAASKAVEAAAPAAPAVKAPAAPAAATGDAMSGTAAWYGRKFNGRKTASGQRFNASALTAAHPSLPFGSRVKVTNTKNKRSVVVVINDRGPTTPGRIVDVSQAAAQRLGFTRAGTTDVTLEVVGKAKMRRAK